jgi:ectoine hydroxylase-related dioxygenase (phytanoyl-CoA dioxygenase family)
LPIEEIEERISAICGVALRARNPYDDQSVFHFRVIRPNSADNNPLHRDVWLEDYAACINLYIPVAGSNARSSLILLPESHYWPESRVQKTVSGAMIGHARFNVPAVTAIEGDYSVMRPDPKENEVLVFSPYLIHGGAVNLNADETRISIEMRLWRK